METSVWNISEEEFQEKKMKPNSEINYNSAEFKALVKNMLDKTCLNEEVKKKCMSSDNLNIFKKAFIHNSFAKAKGIESYDVLEFKGDGLIKTAVTEYITSVKYKKVTSSSYLSELKKYYEQNDTLGFFAIDQGFGKFTSILSSKDGLQPYEYTIKNNNLEDYDLLSISKYRKIYGDLFESFIGAMATVIDLVCSPKIDQNGREIFLPGVSWGIISRFVYNFFDKVDMELPTFDAAGNILDSKYYDKLFPYPNRFQEGLITGRDVKLNDILKEYENRNVVPKTYKTTFYLNGKLLTSLLKDGILDFSKRVVNNTKYPSKTKAVLSTNIKYPNIISNSQNKNTYYPIDINMSSNKKITFMQDKDIFEIVSSESRYKSEAKTNTIKQAMDFFRQFGFKENYKQPF